MRQLLKRRTFLKGLLAGLGALLWGQGWHGQAAARPYHRLVVLGDPHLPVRVYHHPALAEQQAIKTAKDALIDDINSWDDVEAVVVVGDIVEQRAVDAEYAYIRQYFARLHKPLWVINGNHEFRYEDQPDAKGKPVVAAPEVWQRKLQRFQDFWQLPSRWYTKEVGGYHLVFLSAEGPENAQIGESQLAWLRDDLAEHAAQTTLVFFHGPLIHTLLNYNKSVNTIRATAQPEQALADILAANPQVRLWVSGHTHTPATNYSYAADGINRYSDSLVDIHNADLDRKHIWTNSLYLYDDHIDVRTFDHRKQVWLAQFDRRYVR